LSSRGYGFTNLALLLAIVVVLRRLALRLKLSDSAADLSAGIWALNFHGINMALLWTSGRTSLLAVLFATLAATAFLKGRRLLTAALVLMALGSKEEAIAVPFILIAWHAVLNGLPGHRDMLLLGRLVRLGRSTVYLLAPLVIYAAMRTFAGGMLPWNAPSYYRMSADPGVLARNVLEYADRGATFAVAVVILLSALMKTRPGREHIRWRVLVCSGVWFVGGYAVTVFLPVRSSLYACLPSVGAALAAGVLADAIFARRPVRSPAVALAGILAVVLLLVPIYRARNQSWRNLAMLSSSVLYDLRDASSGMPPRTKVLLLDDRTQRANLDSAFGTLMQTAVDLSVANQPLIQIVPPPEGAIPEVVFPPDEAQLRLARRGMRLVRTDPSSTP